MQNIVQSELELGERQLWIGQPSPTRMMLPSLVGFIFGVIWTAFVVNFIVMWYGHSSGEPFGLWGMQGIMSSLFFVPFVLVGGALLLSPAWVYRNARHTVYAITNKRVLIIEAGKSRKVRSYNARELGNIARVERADGTGNVIFAQQLYKDGDGDRQTKDVQFVGIADVRSVERLLRETFDRVA